MASDGDRGTLERSEELRSVTARLVHAFGKADTEAVLARFTRKIGASGFGTDAGEFMSGPEQLARYTVAEFAEFGGFPIEASEIDAWIRGEMGWSIVRAKLGGDEGASLRCSFVFELDRDEWKVVHQHWSVGAEVNEAIWGMPGPLEVIAGAVEDEHPDLSAAAAPDGTVTLVFTDIEGSTALNQSYGDRAWLDVLHAHNEVVTSATLEHSGTVVKGIGDGFMLAFPSARRALHAAQEVQRRIAATFDDPGSPIKVRIGVHTGEVVKEADDFFGHAVNYAARVAGAATGGEVLVSSLAHDLLVATGEFTFDAPREVDLKGIDGEQRVFPLAGAGSQASLR
jgi:class 3 adenylate cyclase/ketosteroid isomerase-like protein